MNLSRSWRAGRMNATSYTGAAEQKDRKVDNVILGLLGAILTAVVTFGVRLDIKNDRTNERIDRTNDRIDAAARDLKEDARIAHAQIGTNIHKLDAKVDEVNKDLKEINFQLGKVVGRQENIDRRKEE